MKSLVKIGAAFGFFMGLSFLPAWALSVDDVLALSKAGVSDETIRMMIENEMAAQHDSSKFIVLDPSGREAVVYRASSLKNKSNRHRSTSVYQSRPHNTSPAIIVNPRPSPKPRPPHSAYPAAPGTSDKSVVEPELQRSRELSFSIQTDAFAQEETAQRHCAQLQTQGLPARVEPVDLPDKGRWYRVMVGSYSSLTKAMTKGNEYMQQGILSDFSILSQKT